MIIGQVSKYLRIEQPACLPAVGEHWYWQEQTVPGLWRERGSQAQDVLRLIGKYIFQEKIYVSNCNT